MESFFIYKVNDDFKYSAKQVFEKDNKIFLIESNKLVNENDIVLIDKNLYDLINNDFYVMVIIDKITKEIIISYGMFSYCHSLYYYKSENNIYINISLHDLLKDIKISPVLDIISVNEFVKYGFINGNRTLIEQIKKIPALKTVIFKGENVEIVDSKYIERNSIGDYVDNLSISLPSKDAKVLIPLSGGYDSTLLAYLLKDYDNKFAITVGSKDDPSSEFKNANNTTSYLNIQHEKIYSDNKWIKQLPKIVYIMEGEMFDPGVFLIYFLVNKIKELNLNDYIFITGDGADQFLNKNFFIEDLDKNPELNRYSSKFFVKYPKHCFYYIIVKKLEWLLRLNNINYIMPFDSKEFYDYSKNTTFSEYKTEYKEFVKSYIPKEISEPLRKRGGLINERYFIDYPIYKKFLNILNNPKYKVLFDNENVNNKDLRNITYRIYIILFNYIFIENRSIDLNFIEILNTINEDTK